MKLKLELDLENPAASMMYLDGRKIGGIQAVTMTADMDRNVFFVDVKGVKMRAEKEKNSWVLLPLQKVGGSVCGQVLGAYNEWTAKQAAELVESLQGNLAKK